MKQVESMKTRNQNLNFIEEYFSSCFAKCVLAFFNVFFLYSFPFILLRYRFNLVVCSLHTIQSHLFHSIELLFKRNWKWMEASQNTKEKRSKKAPNNNNTNDETERERKRTKNCRKNQYFYLLWRGWSMVWMEIDEIRVFLFGFALNRIVCSLYFSLFHSLFSFYIFFSL